MVSRSTSPILLACLAVALGVAAPPAAAMPPQARRERIDVRDSSGSRLLEAFILVEAVDGGLLVEHDDQRYELLPPESIVTRQPIDTTDADTTPKTLASRIVADLPPGFDVLTTKHYVICFTTSRDYAKWCAGIFERLHGAFINYWSRAGLEVANPDKPMVVVIFADRSDYETYATHDLGAAADRVVGYYNLLSNRITTFDLTGTDLLPRPNGRPSGGVGLDILSSPAAAGLIATLVHEATHQMAFNGGLHQRLAPVPLWVSEGIATSFETPDVGSATGWRGIGAINRARLDHFLKHHRQGDLEAIVVSDDRFRAAEGPLDAYAAAWALTRYCTDARRQQFLDYLRLQAAKPPLADDDRDIRLHDFEQAFHCVPGDMEDKVVEAMARLASRPR